MIESYSEGLFQNLLKEKNRINNVLTRQLKRLQGSACKNTKQKHTNKH